MKQKLKNLRNLTTTYDLFIAVGLLMIIATSIKLIGWINYSSDWFWFLTGLIFVIEGVMFYIKQRKFDRKYKIIEKD